MARHEALLRHRADASHADSSSAAALTLAQQSLVLQGNADHRQRQSVAALLTLDAMVIGLSDIGLLIMRHRLAQAF